MAKPMLIYNPKSQFLDNYGTVVSGGKLFTYLPGTTTKQNTYPTAADATAGTNPNPNPVILDSAGRPSNGASPIDMYITQSYKWVLAPSTDTDPPANAIWTEDNIPLLAQTFTTLAKTTNYTLTTSNNNTLITADASGGPWTLSLPSASSAGSGFQFQVKKTDSSANAITISPNGTDNIDGANSSITLPKQNDYVLFESDGTNWWTNIRTSFSNITLIGTTTLSANITGNTTYNSTMTLTGTIAMSGSGEILNSFTDSITAHAGGGQGSATALTSTANRITTSATAGDSVKLPTSVAGLSVIVINSGANSIQVYGAGTDTINGVATGTGVAQMVNSCVTYNCVTAGAWFADGVGIGYSSSLPTYSYVNGLTAHAGGGQGSALALTATINRVTTVGTAADSVILPASAAGMHVTVINAAAANAMNVFPASGEAINALSANTALSVAANKTITFFCAVAGTWNSILTA